ncbi:hypothetical protein CONLIGDRAFT_704741 [Coniochaeta ligniaria NRRL 30616]|uniref:Uncharacterized protein n=1 Tax=Coniochaeta ligniaria NRRL 30616 TaxID=1408157 RepID=A0A1J7IPE5_9PEZI|nr:hypothetical protein CONLIGDRAFT_704741 [Coniochaeta ligniaria NRRL 30616]
MSPDIFDCKLEELSDWDPEDAEPRPPVLKKDGFILRDDKFTVLGHEREKPARIRDYMHVGDLDGVHKEEVQAAIKGMSRRFHFHSQLIHYGIYKKKNMLTTEDYSLHNTILPLMQEALDKRWFDKVPRRILKLENKLRQKTKNEKIIYQRNRAKWDRYLAQKQIKASTDGTTTEKESNNDIAWNSMDDNPGQQANLDMDRFFNHYFLTDGKLDVTKTPNTLRLDNITIENGKEVVRRTKALKGLHYHLSSQTSGSILCVGVDKTKARELAHKIQLAVKEKAMIKHQEDQWKKDMQDHIRLAGQLCQQKVEEFSDSDPVWKLRDCSGLFVVRSEQICQKYPRHFRSTLRISARMVRTAKGLALVARFDFGVCSGTMFLAESIHTLQGLAEGEDRNMDAESDSETSSNTSRKRKAPPTSQRSACKRKTSSRQDSDDDGQEPSLTLLVSFRGRKNLENDKEIFYMPKNGKIDFFDDYHCRLKGNVDLPSIGPVSFEGWKTMKGKKHCYEPRPWHEFSESVFRNEQHNKHQRQKRISRREEKAKLGTKERPYTIQ